MKKRKWIGVFFIVAFSAAFLQSAAFGADFFEKGAQVKFTLPPPDSAQVQSYLGLNAIEPFKVNAIKASVVIIELMSSRCLHCQASAPIMNEIYKKLQRDPGLADVKIVAIALSDDKAGVETFRKQFKTPFPILLDENLEITHSMTGLTTPTILVVSTESANVLSAHPGEIQDADSFIKEVKFARTLEAMDKAK